MVGGTAMAVSVVSRATTNISSSTENPRVAFAACMCVRLPSSGRQAGRATLPSVALRRRVLNLGNGDLGLQLEEVLLANSSDVHQLLDLLERTILLPVRDDERCGLRTDARQCLEFAG